MYLNDSLAKYKILLISFELAFEWNCLHFPVLFMNGVFSIIFQLL